ncbi:CD3e molecule, epsilon associated protein [Megalobrama amblycephala]|uniref:CD3e molecule, epsilon associated protein n=1 Tax=Megalobrama amblycephala TaxID=75352 RepID=UPI0020142451|nr:CD3e molecule, epsilon associated protein [Megalobrama amblycephala]
MSHSGDKASDQTSVAQEKVSTYQCPADFMSLSYDSSVNALLDGGKGKELWLIKAPAGFDPKSFENLKIPLSGLEMLQSRGKAPKTYSVLGDRTAPSDLHLLVSKGKRRKPSLCSPGFSGVLKISKSYENCSENQVPVPIPSIPAPCIPAGLKQRFQPFGSTGAAHMEDEVNVVSPTAPKRTRPDPNEGEERKKKKKKKKDKREEDSEAFIKQEQMQIDCDQLQPSELMEEEPTKERRKKKKVKKEKEIHEDMFDESLILKTEPLDPSYDYNDSPGKTKKKKKKSSRHE